MIKGMAVVDETVSALNLKQQRQRVVE